MKPPKGGGWWWSYNELYEPGCPLTPTEKEVYHLLRAIGRGPSLRSHHAIEYLAQRTGLEDRAIRKALQRLKTFRMIDFQRVKTGLGLRENEYTMLPRQQWSWGVRHEVPLAAAQEPATKGMSQGVANERPARGAATVRHQMPRIPKTKYSRQLQVAVAESKLTSAGEVPKAAWPDWLHAAQRRAELRAQLAAPAASGAR